MDNDISAFIQSIAVSAMSAEEASAAIEEFANKEGVREWVENFLAAYNEANILKSAYVNTDGSIETRPFEARFLGIATTTKHEE
jgi:hypothetical protein